MRKRLAFTLVEMLVATALAGALMLAVLGVTASLGRTTEAFDRDRAGGGRRALIDLIRQDLRQADELTVTENRTELRGRGGIDPSSLEPRDLPCRISYLIHEDGDQRWLVREEEDLTLLSNRNRHREVLGIGVAELRLEEAPEEDGSDASPDRRPLAAAAPPARVRLVVQATDPAATVDEVLVVY